MPLTVPQLQAAKPRAKPYKLADGLGLYVLVTPAGSRLWRFKYRHDGRERLLAFGAFPEVTVTEARARRDDARKKLRDGVDPGAERRAAQAAAAPIVGESLEALAREWHARQLHTWTEGHAHTTMRRLEAYVFPTLGKRLVREIEPGELLATLRRIEARGHLETAHRVHGIVREVFAYGIATGAAITNPATAVGRKALTPTKVRNLPAVTDPREVGALLRAIDDYPGTHIVRCAFRLAPLVFVRPGELRAAEWREFNLDAAEWRIPGERMKRGVAHIVPLARQALAILGETYALTGRGRYVFPSARGDDRPMSNAAITAALRRMGYDRQTMTWHGFRSIASTLLNEQGWNRDAIERQLAHGSDDEVRAAYNRAEYLPERRRMMQAWADYLDTLRGGNVVALHPIPASAG